MKRPEKFGGNREFSSYEEIEAAYAAGEVHAMDLKNATVDGLIEVLADAREYMRQFTDTK